MKDESSSTESDEDSGEWKIEGDDSILMEFDEASGEWEIAAKHDFDFIYDLFNKINDDDNAADAADKTL